MAPPQNSTLINDEIESIASELSRLSPIFNMEDERKALSYSEGEFPRKSDSEEEEDGEFDDDEEEIPIWIGKEPRFISGINATTTCKDIIQALIDDELANGKYVDSGASRDILDYQITENWRDVEQILENDTLILGLWQAWGNMKNEVQFRLKINKYNSRSRGRDSKKTARTSKNDKIGVINKLLKKIVRQGEIIQSHLGQMSEKNTDRRNRDKLKSYFKSKKGKQMIMENFLYDSSILSIATDSFERLNPTKFENEHFFAKYHKSSTLPRSFSNQTKKVNVQDLVDPKWNFNRNCQTTEDEDEIFLVIENKNNMQSDNDSGVFISKKPESKMTISETPKRKYRAAKNYDDVKKHIINQTHANQVTPQEFSRASFRFDQIRREIRKKMVEMEQLLQQEKTLLHKIHEKTIHYNTENNLYNSNANFLNFNIEIDEIQRKLQDCANDIIMDEKELFTIKIKVEETSKTLSYLKGVMGRHQSNNCLNGENANHNSSYMFKENQIQFVNNFDEFCDNNESIVV